VVDAAPPESYLAYSFEQDVELWTKSQDAAARDRVIKQLKIWSVNHEQLASEFNSNWRLSEVEAHSFHLSELAAVGLKAISDPASLEGEHSELEELFASASEPHGGTILALVEPVKKLIESATKN